MCLSLVFYFYIMAKRNDVCLFFLPHYFLHIMKRILLACFLSISDDDKNIAYLTLSLIFFISLQYKKNVNEMRCFAHRVQT